MVTTEQKTEKVILLGVSMEDGYDIEASLDELSMLAETAGASVVGRLTQNRESMHPGTYIGKGKIEELNDLLFETQADTVITDDELSPAQMRNLSDAVDAKVIDRTVLILDIFAKHATSAEGKIQVEMAQLRYTMTRLTGYGRSLSRLGGGIGTRGPGESKIETDRRRIRDRISFLRQELTEIEKHRNVTRNQRKRNQVPVAAIVGYTNAGKSTLLNRITGSEVLSMNMLFATLDPTTRSFRLPGGEKVLFTDTVGFISKLPHHLVEAFKSTLEEAKYADFIIHVVDISNPMYELQMKVVYDTLRDLEVEGKPVVTLFNKSDLLSEKPVVLDSHADKRFFVSAKTGMGLTEFQEALSELIRGNRVYIERLISYREAGLIANLREHGQIESEEYLEDGIYIKGYVPKNMI